MPNFFQGLLITAIVFAFCFFISILLKLAILWIEYKKENYSTKQKNEEPQPKIYYVKETLPQKKKKRKKRKSPDLALKGVVLHPDQFKKIERTLNE